MVTKLIAFSLRHRLLVLILAVAVAAAGLYAARHLAIDAVPDVTTKQVQINVKDSALGAEDIETQITYPIEVALSSLPRRQEIRSISQFGLSQVTVTFDDDVDIYFARQLVNERLFEVREKLPPSAEIDLSPISTGLGEIYYLSLDGGNYSLMDRRTMIDWIVAPQLRKVSGLAEVNTFGGEAKQFQVSVDPERLRAYKLDMRTVLDALERGNRNAGGAYITRGSEQEVVRGSGLIQSLDDIRSIVLATAHTSPVTVADVAEVHYAPAVRQGAMTRNGEGEQVYAITLLLMGENGRIVMERVKNQVKAIQKSLPPGAQLNGFLDRSELINRAIHTAVKNLVEGGLLVIVVLFLFLLQLRAGLIVSSAIPLAMLFAIVGMKYFNVSANLMSLGAIDFGLIVDGAVIIVENAVRLLAEQRREHGVLTREQEDATIQRAAAEVIKPATFGMGIIIAAYIPILTLTGMEGKMFRPMGQTVIMALVGALLFALTVVPALCSFFLKVRVEKENRALEAVRRVYRRALEASMRHRAFTITAAALFFVACAALFPRLGSEFIPELDEGAIALEAIYAPSISLEQVVTRAGVIEKFLKETFPDEVDEVVSRIGRPELATDPMLLSQTDVLMPLRPRAQWKKARTKDELVAVMEEELKKIPGVSISFTQPIKMRMMELIEGVGLRGDVGVKLFGPNREVRQRYAERIAAFARKISGAEDVKVETTAGLPLLDIRIKRDEIARRGISVGDVQDLIETALGGKQASTIVDGNQRFPLVVRLAAPFRADAEAIGRLVVHTNGGEDAPLAELADIVSSEGPVQLSRENGEGRTVVQANVRGRDLGSVVKELQQKLDANLELPPGYHLEYGGTYEKMQSGRARLMLVVPITFGIIFVLLFTTLGSIRQAALVFTGIPFAITGGILLLYFRGMHFSMSAGIGFIALFGVAVLNGVVLVTFINELRRRGSGLDQAIIDGCITRLRPVLMTATVASIGFIPMALATGAGAEVQKPLATVVIGGLISSTILTLLILPALYRVLERKGRPAPHPPLTTELSTA